MIFMHKETGELVEFIFSGLAFNIKGEAETYAHVMTKDALYSADSMVCRDIERNYEFLGFLH